MSKIKISIIMPVYNAAKHIESTLENISQQTLKELEIVIIDDGSKDNSGDICDNYSKMDSRITVIHQKNAGVSVARNKGIENSNGDYIAFIDSDDWIDEDYLQLFVNRLDKVDYDILTRKYLELKNKKVKENNNKIEVQTKKY